MALVDIVGLSGDGCTGPAGEDGVGGCKRPSIISPTLAFPIKMTDTSDTGQAADVQLIKMKFACSLTHFHCTYEIVIIV